MLIALRVVLGFALATEALGLAFGIGSTGSVIHDAVHAGSRSAVAATLLFAAGVGAVHVALGAIAVAAALLARRIPWLATGLAIGPIALAAFGFRSPLGFSVSLQNVRLERETPLALLQAAALHSMLAALACAIVLVAIPFGLIRRGGAERGRPASNGGSS